MAQSEPNRIDDRAAELWRRFQEAVATTDSLLAAHPDSPRAPRNDPRRMALERCVEAARSYGSAWKEAFLADMRHGAPAER